MLRIRAMRPADIPFAIRITNPEGWGIPATDFRRVLSLDGQGSFVATEGVRRVGLATTAHYGRTIAWIGNVVVKRKFRGKHIGQRLVEHAVNYLSKRRVKHIALYSFEENFQFYRDLGFLQGAWFLRLRREPERGRPTFTIETPSKPLTLSSMFALDRKAFGGDRHRLITTLLNEGSAWYFGYKGESSASYILVKKYHDMNEIGPWVSFASRSPELDLQLQLVMSRSGRKPIEISCPLTNTNALKIMKKHHFHEVSKGRTMFYKRMAKIGQPDAIVAHGFLDKG